VDPPGLATEFQFLRLVFDRFIMPVEVARIARRETDSRLCPGLKDTQGSDPKGDKQGGAPPALGASQDERQRDESAHP